MSGSIFEGALEIMREAGIEPRSAQVQLLKHLSGTGAKFVQAPTGVGKSYSVIAHAAASAEETGDHSVIIAADNTLLDQYAMKDLPVMARSGRFSYAVVKGRRHYACASANNEDNPDYQAMLQRCWEVGKERGPEAAKPSDTINACNGGGRCISCAGDGVCQNPDCAHENGICWAKRARKLAGEADIVLTNTSLWLVNATLYNQTDGLIKLIPFGQPYVDEAQQLPGAVRDSLGWTLGPKSGGTLGKRLMEDLQDAVSSIMDKYIAQEIKEGRSADNKSPAKRFKDRALTDQERKFLHDALVMLREDAKTSKEVLDELAEDDIETPMQFLERRIKALEVSLKQETDDGYNLTWIDPEGIHWDVLNAGPAIRDTCMEWEPRMVSATVPGSLPRRTGYPDSKAEFLPQMFDWRNSCDGFIFPESMDPGDWQNKGWFNERWELLCQHIDAVEGGALILATSNADAERLHGLAVARYGAKRLVMVQEPGNTKENPELIRRFKEDGNAILIGVESFWKGVDVEGPALSLVAIWKLPYSVPTMLHNAIGGKTRDMQFAYSSECMHTRFVQGAGRLLRGPKDRGRVVCCDGRLHKVLKRPLPAMSKHLPLVFRNG